VSVRSAEAEIAEVWERRQAGELTRSIARRLGRNGSSIRRLFEDAGGVHPRAKNRASPLLVVAQSVAARHISDRPLFEKPDDTD
jgi:hypothetical protein